MCDFVYLCVCCVVWFSLQPLVLLLLLQQLKRAGLSCLIFTGSVDATHRLSRLLQIFGDCSNKGGVVEFSAKLPQKQRSRIIKQVRRHRNLAVMPCRACRSASSGTARRLGRGSHVGGWCAWSCWWQLRAGEVDVVVSSDAAARGIDVPNLAAVVQYDAPAHLKTYVHRVGRTARAGQKGVSYALLRRQQVHHFKAMMGRIDNDRVRQETVVDATLALLVPRYQAALEQVGDKRRCGVCVCTCGVGALSMLRCGWVGEDGLVGFLGKKKCVRVSHSCAMAVGAGACAVRYHRH